MDIKRLVADDDAVGISADDFACNEGPGVNQAFLHQWHLQTLGSQIPQNQTLNIMNVSLEHCRCLHRRFYSREMMLRGFYRGAPGWCQ